jgi:hypothetical protein
LEKGFDRTYIGPETDSAIGTPLLVDLDIDPSWDFFVPLKGLNPSHGAIRKTSLAGDTFILVSLHKTSPFNCIQKL